MELAAAETAQVEVELWASGAAINECVPLGMWRKGPECKYLLSPNILLWKNFRDTEMLKKLYSDHPCIYHLDSLQALDFNF